MCSSLHDEQHKTTGMCSVVYVCLFELGRANASTSVARYILCSSSSQKHIFGVEVHILVSYVCIQVCVSLLHSQSMKACAELEETVLCLCEWVRRVWVKTFSTLRP